jgi:hypothetical protein
LLEITQAAEVIKGKMLEIFMAQKWWGLIIDPFSPKGKRYANLRRKI